MGIIYIFKEYHSKKGENVTKRKVLLSVKVNGNSLVRRKSNKIIALKKIEDSKSERDFVANGQNFPLGTGKHAPWKCTRQQFHSGNYLTQIGIKSVTHPPSNSKLVSFYFCLFSKMEKKHQGQPF